MNLNDCYCAEKRLRNCMMDGSCGVDIENGKSIKCPVCKNRVFESRGFDKCHHCGYELSDMYVEESLKETKKEERGYLIIAIIVVPIAFAALYYLFDYLLK